MQTFKRTFAVLTLIATTLVLGAGTLVAAIASVAILGTPDTWYFPGDPPWADLGAEGSVLGLIGFGCTAAVMVTTGWRRHRVARLVYGAGAVTLVAAAILPLSVMATRHFGEWAALRAVAFEEIAKLAADGETGRTFAAGPTFRFSRRATPVRIRAVTAGTRPSVLVDFGNGGEADFDLRTMWCTYSD